MINPIKGNDPTNPNWDPRERKLSSCLQTRVLQVGPCSQAPGANRTRSLAHSRTRPRPRAALPQVLEAPSSPGSLVAL